MLKPLLIGLAACLAGCAADIEDSSQQAPIADHAELILAVQADSAETSRALTEMLGNATVTLGHAAQEYAIATIEPDPSVDYRIRIVEPDPSISYKILQVDPGENTDSVIDVRVLDPATGEVLAEETDSLRSLIDRMARIKLLQSLHEKLKADSLAQQQTETTAP